MMDKHENSIHPVVLFFIRHAEAIWTNKRLPGRLPGVDLSEQGSRQAEDLAKHLSALPISEIRSSPLERTMQTAEPLARALGIPVIEDANLLEAECGEWAGKTFKQVVRLRSFRNLVKNPSLRRPPGGESIVEVQARMMRFVEGVLARQTEHKGIVAAFSHADPIKAVVAGLLGLPLELYRRIDIGVASVSTFVVGDEPLMLCANADGARAVSAYETFVALQTFRKTRA